MKTCLDCGKNKRDSSFYKDSKKKCWLRAICKKCFGSRYKYHKSKRTSESRKAYMLSEKGICRTLLNNAKKRAKDKWIEYSLDKERLIVQLRKWVCSLSWLPFVLWGTEKFRANPFWPSIDKIDPKWGYTKENCRLVCFCVNMARSDWWDETLFNMAEWILKVKALTWRD